MARGTIPGIGQVDQPTRVGLLSLERDIATEAAAWRAADIADAIAWAAGDTAERAALDSRIRRGVEASKATGDTLYWATDTKRLWLYDGTGWIILAEPSQSYTPSLTNLTLGTGGTNVGVYHRSDGYVDFAIRIQLGTAPTMGTAPVIGLPIAAFDGVEHEVFRTLYYDATGPRYHGVTYLNTTSTVGLQYATLAGFGPVSASTVTATLPFTWAVNDYIVITGRYRMTNRYS